MDRWAECTDIKQHGPDYSTLGHKKSAKEVLSSTVFCKVWPWDMSAVEEKMECLWHGTCSNVKRHLSSWNWSTSGYFFGLLLKTEAYTNANHKKTYHHFVSTTFQGCPQGYNYIPLNNNCGGFALCKYFYFKKMIQGIAAPVELSAFYLIIKIFLLINFQKIKQFLV